MEKTADNKCDNNQTLPFSSDYLTNLDTITFGLTIAALVLGGAVLLIFLLITRCIYRYVSDRQRRRCYFIISAIFPVTVICGAIAVTCPRTLAIMETSVLIMLAVMMHKFVDLVQYEFGGMTKMSESLTAEHVQLQPATPPCCCCRCLPPVQPTKRNLQIVKLVAYQLCIVRPLTVFISMVYTVNNNGAVNKVMQSVFGAIDAISSISAMYSITVLMSATWKILAKHRIRYVHQVIQLFLVLDLQTIIFNILTSTGVIQCTNLMPATARAQIWNRLLEFPEALLIILLSCWQLRPSVNATFDDHPTMITRRQPEKTTTVPAGDEDRQHRPQNIDNDREKGNTEVNIAEEEEEEEEAGTRINSIPNVV